jgi:chemotaxis protein MotB
MRKLWIGLGIVFVSTSCVSKKKYTDAVQSLGTVAQNYEECVEHKKELEQVLNDLSQEYTAYQQKSKSSITQLEENLENQSSELSNKDQALQDRAKRLRSLENQFKQQQQAVNALRKTMADALVNFDTEELSVEIKKGKVYISLSDKLLFPSASADLNKEGKEAISKVAEVLEKNGEISIEIIGHTDNKPIRIKYANNWALSTARAITITQLLTDEHGIPGERLTASGMSEYSPVASNDTPEGRAKNRRTEIVLSPQLDKLLEILENKK